MAASFRNSRKLWERLAGKDAYFAVLTEEDYQVDRLDDGQKNRFFETGRGDVESFLKLVTSHIRPGFRPGRVLEYGCGVGRLMLPLARISDEVTGIDISTGMLEEAAANLRRENLENFSVFPAASAFEQLGSKRFDFVLSYIVFQHIPPAEGLPILEKLVSVLEEGGVGLFHFMNESGLGRLGRILQRRSFGRRLLNLMRGRPIGAPVIPMYPYSMDDVLKTLRCGGVDSLHLQLTDHGGESGAICLFEKRRS